MNTTLGELARLLGGRVDGDPQTRITGIAGIKEAHPGDVTFLSNGKYAPLVDRTRASAIIMAETGGTVPLPSIRVANPDLAFIRIVDAYNTAPPDVERGVHATAIIGKNVTLGRNVAVLPYSVIDDGAKIGDDTVLYPHVYIGRETQIGAACLLYPGVVVRERVRVGNRVILHSGTVLGCDGFGYVTVGGIRHKIPQTGTVIVEDDVEIGANTTVDRARFDVTIIKHGTKIDNLVQVAHNVSIGENCIIVAQAGIAGSTRIGRGVVLAGQSGVSGHVDVGDHATVAGKAGVTKNVPAHMVVSGFPARDHLEQRREQALLRKLPDMSRLVKTLREQVEALETRIRELEKASANHPTAGRV